MELEIEKEGPKSGKPATSSAYKPEVALQFFKAFGKAEAIAVGKTVFVENEGAANVFSAGSKMYFLFDGLVELSIAKKAIGSVSKGEIFGEMASITHLPRSATATAKTPVRSSRSTKSSSSARWKKPRSSPSC